MPLLTLLFPLPEYAPFLSSRTVEHVWIFQEERKTRADRKQGPHCEAEGRTHQDKIRVYRQAGSAPFRGKKINEDLLEDLEAVLFTSDLGVGTTRELIRLVQEGVARKELDQPEKLRAALKGTHSRFSGCSGWGEPEAPGAGEPHVIMMIGVNGVGKTTTIGKLGHRLRGQGNSVMFVAADTFRAAAVEQLEIWAQRVGAELVKQRQGADPSAVVFDALSSALSKQMDVVIIDTAGRLHTKSNLMGGA